jgi:hypothetical protein
MSRQLFEAGRSHEKGSSLHRTLQIVLEPPLNGL